MISTKFLLLTIVLFVALISKTGARYIKKVDDDAKAAAMFVAQRQSMPTPGARVVDPIDASSA